MSCLRTDFTLVPLENTLFQDNLMLTHKQADVPWWDVMLTLTWG